MIDLRVVKAAQACGAHEMILRLPKGYDTPVGWGGQGLAAGQAQQMALARALYGRPNILLLDEPNAHLDAEGEQKLTATLLQEKARGASILVAAHRTSILAAVDKLLVLRDGVIEAFGPRDEVLRRISAPAAVGQASQAGRR
jgi:ATP-binding cassette subfamily C protein